MLFLKEKTTNKNFLKGVYFCKSRFFSLRKKKNFKYYEKKKNSNKKKKRPFVGVSLLPGIDLNSSQFPKRGNFRLAYEKTTLKYLWFKYWLRLSLKRNLREKNIVRYKDYKFFFYKLFDKLKKKKEKEFSWELESKHFLEKRQRFTRFNYSKKIQNGIIFYTPYKFINVKINFFLLRSFTHNSKIPIFFINLRKRNFFFTLFLGGPTKFKILYRMTLGRILIDGLKVRGSKRKTTYVSERVGQFIGKELSKFKLSSIVFAFKCGIANKRAKIAFNSFIDNYFFTDTEKKVNYDLFINQNSLYKLLNLYKIPHAYPVTQKKKRRI